MASPTLDEESTSQTRPAGRRPPSRIAEFRDEDAATVAAMFNDSNEGWPGGFNGGVEMTADHVLRRQREQRPLATFIAWEGDRAAGFCSFFEYPTEPGVAGYVGLLNVATSFQGRGYGRDLLKAALRRSVECGYRRLDLHTWAGNMKAVPLYKKSGYFWVPESHVHMENYLPLLLGIPALADFWAEAEPYATQVRDLSVKEDLILDGKMRMYPYEFRHGDRYVRATIDATARGLTMLETERWRVSCTVDDRRLVVGQPRTVRWEAENRTGSPLPLTLIATAGKGLLLHKEETVLVSDRYSAEATLDAERDYQPPPFGEPAPRVESLLLLDGLPIRLETGVEIEQPIEVRFDPRRIMLPCGRTRDVVLRVRGNLEQPAEARLTLAPSPGLTVLALPDNTPPQPLTLTLGAESYAGAMLRLRADEPGVHSLEIRPVVTVDGAELDVAPVALPVPAVSLGGLVALTADAPDNGMSDDDVHDREARIESEARRLVARLREGYWQLAGSSGDEYLIGGLILAGPPFSFSAQPRVRHEATFERRDGLQCVILRGALAHLPDAVVEHELGLTPDGLLRVRTAVTNMAAEERDVQAMLWLWPDREAMPTVALPTVHGLVAGRDPEFPDWSEEGLHDPSMFTETWMALQGDGRVVGVLWDEAARIELGAIRQDATALRPGERRVLPPLHVHAGSGDWQSVRERWRALVRPDAPPHAPRPRDVVRLAPRPISSTLLAGSNRASLDSATNRELTGQLTIEAPAGWEIEPATREVTGLRIGKPQELELTVRRVGAAPRTAPVRARLRDERGERVVFDGAALDLGTGERVTVTAEERDGDRLLCVDNGYLRFRLAPGFLGSVVSLETLSDGVNHLLSAYPETREFGWMRPWYGGLYAAVYSPGPGGFPGCARLDEETFEAQETSRPSHDGREWRGVAVHSILRGKGLRGLESHADYLTLPGSNLLAVRVAVRNTTGATLTAQAALAAYLQPGGSVEEAELLLDPQGNRRLRRAQRTDNVPADGWVGVRSPRRGDTIALVCGDRAARARVYGVDWGALGAHAGVTFNLRLGPGAERGAWSFLALARDEAEARAYRALTEAEDVP